MPIILFIFSSIIFEQLHFIEINLLLVYSTFLIVLSNVTFERVFSCSTFHSIIRFRGHKPRGHIISLVSTLNDNFSTIHQPHFASIYTHTPHKRIIMPSSFESELKVSEFENLQQNFTFELTTYSTHKTLKHQLS